jgi:hypothetical protein
MVGLRIDERWPVWQYSAKWIGMRRRWQLREKLDWIDVDRE